MSTKHSWFKTTAKHGSTTLRIKQCAKCDLQHYVHIGNFHFYKHYWRFERYGEVFTENRRTPVVCMPFPGTANVAPNALQVMADDGCPNGI